MRLRLLALVVVCAALLPALVWGQTTIYVDDDAPGDPGPGDPAVSDPLEDGSAAHPFDAIQEGIDAAVDTDTVLVLDGTYTGDGNRGIEIPRRGLTVRSENGPASTVVDAEYAGPGFVFEPHPDPGTNSSLEGLTVWHASGSGVSSYVDEGTILVRNCIVRDGQTTGMYASDIVLLVEDCTIENNADHGVEAGNLTISDCTIVGNGGSGVYAMGDAITITDCHIEGNAYSGVYLYSTNPIAISGCTIAGNTGDQGAGICCQSGTLVVTNSRIADNHAEGTGGGGIRCFSGVPLEMTSCTLTGNTAQVIGGGVHANSTVVMVDCIVTANGLPGTNPPEGRWGGGICTWFGGHLQIRRSLVAGNSAGRGGGISCETAEVENCIIANNEAVYAAGIECSDDIVIASCTVTENVTDDGAAILATTATLTNCILWGNGAEQLEADTITAAYCCVEDGSALGWYDPTTCIETDPQLDEDHHLTATSPCIDWCPTGPATDVDGQSRPFDVPGVGFDGERLFDIGADEAKDIDGDGMDDDWELANGLDPNDPTDATLDADGDWLLNVEEFAFGSHPHAAASPAFVYVDDDAAGNPVQDGTLANPYEAIQLAVDAATAPAVVKVLAGTYNEAIVIPEGVWVVGPGVASATINAGNTAHAVEFVDAGEGLLAGFAVTAGGTTYHGLKTTGFSSPTIRNCTFTGSRSGMGLAGDGVPRVVNCLIAGNPYQGIFTGGTAAPTIMNCTIADNDVNGIVNWGSGITITNSILYGNADDVNGGGITASYCDIGDGDFAGTNGNISADPLFFNASAGDYRLLSGSPCIDAGTSDGAPSLDLVGASRSDDPDVPNTGGGDLPWYDIGAYERYTIFYVNGTTGDDAYDGLAPVWDGVHGPKRTIQAGIDAATEGSTVSVADGTYKGYGNKNLDFGGKAIAVQSQNGPDLTIVDCENSGRGSYFYSGETNSSVLDGLTIANGYVSSGYMGAGIKCTGASPTIRNCVIRDCSAGSRGGGIGLDGSSAVLEDCVVSGCLSTVGGSAESFGGGIYCLEGANVTIRRCTIEQNATLSSATRQEACYGGGVYCEASVVVMDQCIIRNNTAARLHVWRWPPGFGAGVAFRSCDVTMTNCVVVGNNSHDCGGAVYCEGDTSLDAINCTFAGNVARWAGGGFCCDDLDALVPRVTLTNCVLWGNVPDEIDTESCVPSVTYSCIQGGWPGEGNISSDPLLTPDHHLTASSPCIDWCPTGPVDDMDGEPRPTDIPGAGYDDPPDARTYDIGADEYVDTDLDGLPDYWESTNGLDPNDDGSIDPVNGPDGNPDADGLDNLDEYTWYSDPWTADTDGDSRNDGTEVADGTNPTHPDNAEKVYYVNGSTGDDAHDGLAKAWDGTHGPKATIQAGMDAALDGWSYTVEVADGTYTGDGNRDLDFWGKAMTVRSEHGAGVTIIDCQASPSDEHQGFIFFEREEADSVVEGFTIKDGDAMWGGGIHCNFDTAPTIKDCIITDCSGSYGGGIYTCDRTAASFIRCTVQGNYAVFGAGICDGGGGVISDCRIIANRAGTVGGGMYFEWQSGLVVENCLIADNMSDHRGGGCAWYESDAELINCTITGNRAVDDGGAIHCWLSNATVTNCIVWGNTASVGRQIALTSSSDPSSLVVRYSDVQGGASEAYVESGCTLDLGGTNIDDDPLLTPDKHLSAGSPCVDRCPTGPADDQDGEVRPFDVTGVGNDGADTYDIGADEFVDTDGDGLPDWWELEYFGSTTAAGAGVDEEPDGLTNLAEYEHGTSPFDADTDDDGRDDGQEIGDDSNPLHPDNPEKTYYVNGDPLVGDNGYDGLAPTWDGVHGPKLTIQAGIDATITGWGYSVQAADGTYTGTGNRELDFDGKAITVKSQNGADACIIDCEKADWAFHFHSHETAASVVDGFTITNGRSYPSDGGAIYCEGSDPTIANCTIVGNSAYDDGGAIYCKSSDPTITNCTIVSNEARYDGGAIYCENSDPMITNCTIAGNSATYLDGGAIYCENSGPMITNCTITGNSAADDGGGICCHDNSIATMTNCILWANTSPDGHEIALTSADYPSTLIVRYSDVQGGAGEAYVEAGCTLDMDASNIDGDPLFVSSGGYDYFLSQTAAGQPVNSPCVDAGSDAAANLGLDELTTRTDRAPDSSTADMGCHLPYEFWITDVYLDQATTSVVVTFNSKVGVDYGVESAEADAYADGLTWSELTSMTGAGPTTTVTDNLSTNPLTYDFRFYRVRRADESEWSRQMVAVFELDLTVGFAMRQFFVSTPLIPDADHTDVADVLSTQLNYTGVKLDKLTADSGLCTRATYTPGVGWANTFPIAAGEAYWLDVGDATPVPHKVRLTGYVPELALTVSVTRPSFAVTRRWMAYSMPRPTTLGALGLETAITPIWEPTNEVRLLPLGTTVWKRCFYDGTNWREGSLGGTLADTTPIACGEGIIFIHNGVPGQPDTLTWPTWYLRPPTIW